MSVVRGVRRASLWMGDDVDKAGALVVGWLFLAGFTPLWLWITGIHAGFGGDHTYAQFMWLHHKLWEHDWTVSGAKGTPWPIIYGECGFLVGGYVIGFGSYWYQRWRYIHHGQREHWKRMVKRYGRRVGRDDHGTLWRIPALVAGRDPINVVEVTDATAVQGKHQRYWLHVPMWALGRSVDTPKEAVAWTFGFSAEQYNPVVQT